MKITFDRGDMKDKEIKHEKLIKVAQVLKQKKQQISFKVVSLKYYNSRNILLPSSRLRSSTVSREEHACDFLVNLDFFAASLRL